MSPAVALINRLKFRLQFPAIISTSLHDSVPRLTILADFSHFSHFDRFSLFVVIICFVGVLSVVIVSALLSVF